MVKVLDLSVYPELLKLAVGDTCRVVAYFEYVGPGITGVVLYAAIGKKGVTFNEIVKGSKSWDIPETGVEKTLSIYVDIPITSAIAVGTGYDMYAKLTNIPGADLYSPYLYDNIEITGPKQYALDIWISPEGSGSVQKNPDYGSYNEGQRVTLTAIDTNPNYQWVGYTGDVASTSKVITVTMDRDYWVVAQWKLIPPPEPPPAPPPAPPPPAPPEEMWIVYFSDGSSAIMTESALAALIQMCMYDPNFCGIVSYEKY